MDITTFDDRTCALGEGPLWHPERQQLFWFDILGKQLMTRNGDTPQQWQMDEHVSAAGWVEANTLLIAGETSLFKFDLDSGDSEFVVALEADNPTTRSNDGRADPYGGFWISTMGKNAEHEAGSIYRYFNGELRRIFHRITIPNAICFSPDGSIAYFADTRLQIIWSQKISEKDGWPIGDPKVFLDLSAENLNPDGAVVDANGFIWNAQWGAARVARYAPDGRLDLVTNYPAQQISCPAFGGPDLRDLFVTSAAVGLNVGEKSREGMTFVNQTGVAGQVEHQVVL
ncbi:MAG: SMP-30/gluconolactonase/LRE family protein [Paracoccaceae bacterium]